MTAPEAIVTLFAALRAGLVVVPLALRLPPLQVAYVLGHCAARALVTERAFLERLSPEQRTGPEWIITVGYGGRGHHCVRRASRASRLARCRSGCPPMTPSA